MQGFSLVAVSVIRSPAGDAGRQCTYRLAIRAGESRGASGLGMRGSGVHTEVGLSWHMAEEERGSPLRPTPPDLGLIGEAFRVDNSIVLERIRSVGQTARIAWLGLLGYLAFVVLTLAGVRDIDFYSVDSRTTLPIANVAIPITTFFLTAPWLGVALHVYMHMYLEKLWAAVAQAPSKIDGQQLGDRIFPWLVIDWALRRRADQPIEARPMDWLADKVTAALVWLAAPGVLLMFWIRAIPGSDSEITGSISIALSVTIYASIQGYGDALARLNKLDSTKISYIRRLSAGSWPISAAIMSGLILSVVSFIEPVSFNVLSTKSKYWRQFTNITWPGANLQGAEIATKPDDWLSYEMAERSFRSFRCSELGLPHDACSDPQEAYHRKARLKWCSERGIADCERQFERIDHLLFNEGREARREYISRISRPDLSFRKLRDVFAANSFATGVNFRATDFYRTDFENAQLEGSDFRSAEMESADFSGAWLYDSDMSFSKIQDTDFKFTKMERSNLANADLIAVDFGWADLDDVNLYKTNIELVNFYGSSLKGTYGWDSSNIGHLILHYADFSGAYSLKQTHLVLAIGDDDTILPRDEITGEQLYVWSCWSAEPEELDRLLRFVAEDTREDYRSWYVCDEGEEPRRVGRSAMVDDDFNDATGINNPSGGFGSTAGALGGNSGDSTATMPQGPVSIGEDAPGNSPSQPSYNPPNSGAN